MRVASGAQSQPIKVGLTSTLSKHVAQLGITAKNGSLLEFDAFDAVGRFDGRTIEPVDRDSKSRPEDAVRLTRELIESEGCDVRFWGEASGSAFAAHEVARSSKAPLMHVISETTKLITIAGLVGTGLLPLCLGVNYDKERRVFRDRPSGSCQGIQFPRVRAAAALSAAGLVSRRAAWLMDDGQPLGSEGNTAKLIAGDAALKAYGRAMQFMGGMGAAAEYHVERRWRHARIFAIAPVPQEMMLSFIATHDLGLLRSH
jgi:hypothetical protein